MTYKKLTVELVDGNEVQVNAQGENGDFAICRLSVDAFMDAVWAASSEEEAPDYEDGMDGDHESALASCGWGTDEDYGYFGE